MKLGKDVATSFFILKKKDVVTEELTIDKALCNELALGIYIFYLFRSNVFALCQLEYILFPKISKENLSRENLARGHAIA